MFDAIGEPGHAESMTVVSGYYKQNRRGVHADKLALLDALCDQIATALGVAQAYQFDIQGALAEVNRSNWSKFVDGLPIKDANGKISKPLGYSKPELSQFIRRYPESENEGSEP
jgi:predicted HAD superfamily Cof-like phosphohydrolase